MVAEIARRPAKAVYGHTSPRIAPPVPAKSDLAEYEAAAAELNLRLMPHQKIAARYMTGRKGKRWAFREVALVMARQNGKTTMLLPRILMGLKRGEQILHTAQNRDIPRKTFLRIAATLAARDDVVFVRRANGQEEILHESGGRYKLVAPNDSSRGETADLVLIDEVRQQTDYDLMDAILPTMIARKDPQVIYLSNAGEESSVVLNDLRRRATEEEDQTLAYLEWSASPGRALDDREGWAEANPALGYGDLAIENLDHAFRTRPPASYETENLCRWVITTMPTLVEDEAWANCEEQIGEPIRPVLGVSLDPSGTRASAVTAWGRPDGTIAVRPEEEYTGDPIDVTKLDRDVLALAVKIHASRVAYSKTTDSQMVMKLPKAQQVDGRDFESASQTFAQLVAGRGIRWDDADGVIALDLRWTARKTSEEMRTFHAVRAKEDRPITAALAAIRAVYLVSQQLQSGTARIY